MPFEARCLEVPSQVPVFSNLPDLPPGVPALVSDKTQSKSGTFWKKGREGV
ncbi:hypothetical protein BaRGS_00002479, partial [Batillaria attramentaria]